MVSPRPSRWLLPLLALGQLIAAVDYNIVYVALPSMGADLGFQPQNLQWVVSAYAVAYGGLLLLGGRAADIVGRARTYRAALALFGIGSLMGALAPSVGVLVAGRIVQGIGGALLLPATLATLANAFDEGAQRHRALAIWGGAGAVGLAAGSLLGGLLTQAFGWRAVLMVNVPLVLLALVMSVPALPRDGARGRLRHIGLGSGVSVTVAVTALVFALSEGPALGWTTSSVLGALVLAAAAAAVLVVVERGSAAPLLPVTLLRHRPLLAAMGVTFLFMASFGTEYYLFTVYFQDVQHYTVLAAGLAFVPAAGIGVLSSHWAGRALSRFGVGRTLNSGLLLGGLGMLGVAAAMGPHRPYVLLLPGIVALSIGQGLGWTAMFAAAGTGVSPHHQGIAGALASTSQQIGAAIGLAVLVAVADAPRDPARPRLSDTVAGLRWAGVGAAALVLLGIALSTAYTRAAARGGAAAEMPTSGSPHPDRTASLASDQLHRPAEAGRPDRLG